MAMDSKPVVAMTLGDAAGIGGELIAKLLADPERLRERNVVLIGDAWHWERAQAQAGVRVPTSQVSSFAEVRLRPDTSVPGLLPVNTLSEKDAPVGTATGAAGKSALDLLNLSLDAAQRREVDAICFPPLNKQALKLGGMRHEDESHHFASYLGVEGYFCEFNTLGELWTSRVSSHIPLKDAASYLTRERIKDATRLIYRSLQAAGHTEPRVAVAAFNPHGGDGGTCGREEVDIIEPAVRELNAEGLPVQGPFPADTIFVRAQEGAFQAIVTMYHDQGQIAIKLLGFSRGVTVHGGLPIPITTPAHGTAYDIAGKGMAKIEAMSNAFELACRMASR